MIFMTKPTNTDVLTLSRKYADICPLLEVDDMVRMKKPDWKCVFTYVQSFYRRFRNGRDLPHQRSKTIAVGAHEAREISSKLSLHPNIQVTQAFFFQG